jgi:hypothetical protein
MAAFAWNWYWRESTDDGIYAFGSGVPIDPAGASHARYLGNQGDLEIQWAPVEHTVFAFNFAGFKPGTFFNSLIYKPLLSRRISGSHFASKIDAR